MAKIMIVDDALFMRQMLAKILIAEGHEICAEATNAKEAVEKFKTVRPDLVTMDIVMPLMEELDGIGAVNEIMKLDPKAKILIVSAMSQQPIVVEAIRLGARDFLSKPVNPQRLKEVVKSILTEPLG
ncbi:MAG: two-component system response regulator [Omnitrophica WOR_2 bacterium GWF2_43_52]|nr:MAG: two-component system response regulator [Omnitrophica WOR_2 bacterium GWA2_44_7]OGX17546.1 MAG: two-component system response regulator [Omnitrophica WOR_2 bacterium GWC2_44_8]OGX20484.1 MAG: two-component system response regulator [Omnitrophica WOR_2 bacterium GWF2_43_52]OGX53377.1 MAG: two-component system response regulator [Omnitrophica WOR_2 bacterium RIFOXYC2_FULL_43_9]HAH20539.1 two-component system response regulator [Candidatus Omnitrophota bacterium]